MKGTAPNNTDANHAVTPQNPFLVPKKDGSYRMVINLRPLNQHMEQVHFKMESPVKQDHWMASIDLKDAYLSVKIWEDHQKYLQFQWQGSTYEFCCLPFGLSSAPRVFTKLMKPVLVRLRHHGVHLIMCLDDMLLVIQSREELGRQLIQIMLLLESLGFVINKQKSQLLPTQTIQYLGFLWTLGR